MITRLLIANRGEIACRIIRTARAMGIATVAVYADPDSAAAHVQAAEVSVPLGGVTAAETYLDVDRLLAAAESTGADAVHPGYGFLAESAPFAQAVQDAGLLWVGPSPDAIASMGDKITAKQMMEAAGVPTLQSVTDPDLAEDIGYPLIVKAAAGGGGRGMRVVQGPGDLEQAVAAARREAASAFGDDRVFLERFLHRPRHIEVQILGDAHGHVVHLGERECSLQRRHQKVIEEAPSPTVDEATRTRLGQAAVTAARAMAYEGAGTVEFVASNTSQGELTFYFLEVNTRLQVEHPVTEQVWRVARDPDPLDLVRLQLLVADGQPLPFSQEDLHPVGHAIEARLYAEDAAAGFLPATGDVELLEPAHLPGVRWDTGVRTGDTISPYFDPMIAKVIATAPTRTEAAALAARELSLTRLHGVTTNRDALVTMLTHPAFLAADLHTGFIEQHLGPDELMVSPSPLVVRTGVVAATLAGVHQRRDGAGVQATIPAGWRNNRSQPTHVGFEHGATSTDVWYAPAETGKGSWLFEISGTDVSARVHRIVAIDTSAGKVTPGRARWELDLELDDRRTTISVVALTTGVDTDGMDRVWLVDTPLGSLRLVEVPRFPLPKAPQVEGGLIAPMPGAVVSLHAEPGDIMARGELLLVLEAMKMEHRITAPHAGVVKELRVAVGDQVDSQAVLAVITDEEQP